MRRERRAGRLGAFLLLLVFSLMLCGFTTTGGKTNRGNLDIPQMEYHVYVYDMEGSVDDALENTLNKKLESLENKTDIHFVVVTVESFNGATIEDCATDMFNALGLGSVGDKGLLFFVSEKEGHGRLATGVGMEETIPDIIANRILREFYGPNRDSGEFNLAVEQTVGGVFHVLKNHSEDVPDFEDMDAYEVLDKEEETNELTPEQIRMILIITVLVIIGIILDGRFNEFRITQILLEILRIIAECSASGSGGSSSSSSRSSGSGHTRGGGSSW